LFGGFRFDCMLFCFCVFYGDLFGFVGFLVWSFVLGLVFVGVLCCLLWSFDFWVFGFPGFGFGFSCFCGFCDLCVLGG